MEKKEQLHEQPTLPHIRTETLVAQNIPRDIGPYKIESLLSQGGMSLLYLGLHPDSRRPIAVKVLKSHYLTHPEMKGQFLKEAEVIELADHPNIVKLYGHGEWEGGLYIAMEWLKGISLKQFILQRSLSLKRSLDISLQVCYALLHLHTHGVIHRDLKPENILLTESGQVKVIDFGIAQVMWQPGEAPPKGLGGVIGTPSYMSPEQRKDPLHVTVAADIYSLGVMMYELVVGKLSFGNIQLELVPKQLRAIIKKTLEPKLEDRYSDIVDLITDLSSYLRSNAIQTERRATDEIKEVYEELASLHQNLIMQAPPQFSELDVGISKLRGIAPLSLYYDLFKLPNGQFMIYLAKATSNDAEGLTMIAYFKGLVDMLMERYQTLSDEPLDLANLATQLNSAYCKDHLNHPLHLHLLHLDPSDDKLTAISCGFEPLWHLESGVDVPRLIESRNDPLGTDSDASFLSVSDNWEDGDSALLHTFDAEITHIQNLFTDHRDLSPAPCANAIISDIENQKMQASQNSTQAVVILQRLP